MRPFPTFLNFWLSRDASTLQLAHVCRACAATSRRCPRNDFLTMSGSGSPAVVVDEYDDTPTSLGWFLGALPVGVLEALVLPKLLDVLEQVPPEDDAAGAAAAAVGLQRFAHLGRFLAANGACKRLVEASGLLPHADVLRWASQRDVPWDESTFAAAAHGGSLEVLKWARAHGCPWNEGTCSFAALGGHLEVLKWARAHGCPWNEWTREHAARYWPTELLQ